MRKTDGKKRNLQNDNFSPGTFIVDKNNVV